MNLEKFLYSTNRFVDLEPVIRNVKEGVSFWGKHYLYIPGEKGTYSIDILTKRIRELMKDNKFEYSNAERIAGKKIAAKIDQLYADNENRLQRKWSITRFLSAIRGFYTEIKYGTFNDRFYWQDCYENEYFELYTKKQYPPHLVLIQLEANLRGIEGAFLKLKGKNYIATNDLKLLILILIVILMVILHFFVYPLETASTEE